MRRFIIGAIIAIVPGALIASIPVGGVVWLWRRWRVKNAVRFYQRENPGRVQPKAEA